MRTLAILLLSAAVVACSGCLHLRRGSSYSVSYARHHSYDCACSSCAPAPRVQVYRSHSYGCGCSSCAPRVRVYAAHPYGCGCSSCAPRVQIYRSHAWGCGCNTCRPAHVHLHGRRGGLRVNIHR